MELGSADNIDRPEDTQPHAFVEERHGVGAHAIRRDSVKGGNFLDYILELGMFSESFQIIVPSSARPK
jgi:hypothetical protein